MGGNEKPEAPRTAPAHVGNSLSHVFSGTGLLDPLLTQTQGRRARDTNTLKRNNRIFTTGGRISLMSQEAPGRKGRSLCLPAHVRMVGRWQFWPRAGVRLPRATQWGRGEAAARTATNGMPCSQKKRHSQLHEKHGSAHRESGVRCTAPKLSPSPPEGGLHVLRVETDATTTRGAQGNTRCARVCSLCSP